MATISITNKIEFNRNDANKIAKAIKNVDKLTIKNNPQKISKEVFLKKLAVK